MCVYPATNVTDLITQQMGMLICPKTLQIQQYAIMVFGTYIVGEARIFDSIGAAQNPKW